MLVRACGLREIRRRRSARTACCVRGGNSPWSAAEFADAAHARRVFISAVPFVHRAMCVTGSLRSRNPPLCTPIHTKAVWRASDHSTDRGGPMRSRLLVPVLALTLTGVITSCDDESISGIDDNFEENATWVAELNGANERPTPLNT